MSITRGGIKKELVFIIEVRFDVEENMCVDIENILETARANAAADIIDVRIDDKGKK